jgi:hypothetical protein
MLATAFAQSGFLEVRINAQQVAVASGKYQPVCVEHILKHGAQVEMVMDHVYAIVAHV